MQANTKHNGNHGHRNHSGTRDAEANQVYAKKQCDQPAPLHHGPFAGQPSPQQDGKHSDAHGCAQGVGITPDIVVQAEITDRRSKDCDLTSPEHATEKTVLATEKCEASTGIAIKQKKSEA